ncbi:MAG: PilN domain-containing protein [Xanthomonadaceae bacterium]|nr:PilN domain-containing protein [Xanthomonadaceae bacterium]
MRTINLLPWREDLRRERQRNFLIVLGVAALVAALCVFLVKQLYDARIDNQNARNAFLQSEITTLDQRIKKIERLDETRQRLLERKDVIESLQANRTLMVRLFDQLVRTVPSGIRLLDVQQVDQQLTINGTSQSSARVSTYLRNLESSPILSNPQLEIIEAEQAETTPQMPYGFRIRTTLGVPDEPEQAGGSGAEGTSP